MHAALILRWSIRDRPPSAVISHEVPKRDDRGSAADYTGADTVVTLTPCPAQTWLSLTLRRYGPTQ